MAEIVWAPSALDDIGSIAEYIARDSEDQAYLFVRRLLHAANRLQDFPRLGRVIPEIGDTDCREIIYGAYRIMYRIEENEIWITGIVQVARDWKPE